MIETVAASVIVPTLGRPQLAACLESIASCRPLPSEVVLIDQSGSECVEAMARESSLPLVRVIKCEARGIALALNIGLRESSNSVVFVTNDDCTVRSSWIQVAWDLLERYPHSLITGRVLPGGVADGIPSTFTSDVAEDLTGRHLCSRLYGANMAVGRRDALSLGGWDELLVDAAEDNDFGYRWLRDGRSMRYEPEMVVWHHDWRTPDQLKQQYERYALGQGVFYGKTLYEGDLRVLRFLLFDLGWATRGQIARVLRDRKGNPWPDQRRSLLPALPRGIRDGWQGAAKRTRLVRGRRLDPESRRIREARRRPLPTQWDYLHLRRLRDDLREAIARLPESPRRVLDLYCGTRPYEDLLANPAAEVIGLDIDNRHGLADVVTDVFLPFGDDTFDLVFCAEAFHYVPEPARGAAELLRVLRPGGFALVSVPLVWEYNPTILEHRFTGPTLARLFEEWEDVRVIANGDRAVAWATLTGRLVNLVEERGIGPRLPLHAAFSGLYLGLNGLGALADWAERRLGRGSATLPMNLLLSARKP